MHAVRWLWAAPEGFLLVPRPKAGEVGGVAVNTAGHDPDAILEAIIAATVHLEPT